MKKSIRFSLFLLFLIMVPGYASAVTRFVALGDAGEGNIEQYQVGIAMSNVCAKNGCDFALYLGDNFYNNGVDNVLDPQFSSKFELPYAQLDFPFYVALGNHDYGASGLEFWKTWYEIGYTNQSPTHKWQLPSAYYKFSKQDVDFFVIDSQSSFLNWMYDEQQNWLQQSLAGSNAKWKIVVAHHPYVSNGQHGNAGNYEGCSYSFCKVFNGYKIKQLVDTTVCGKADFYFSGHDHNMQWLKPRCGTNFVVSGAGAKTTALVHRDNNPVYWESDSQAGFMWVEIDGPTMTGVFYDLYGNELYRRVETR